MRAVAAMRASACRSRQLPAPRGQHSPCRCRDRRLMIRQSASEPLTRAIRPQSDRQEPCQYHEPQRMTDQTPPCTHPPMMHAVNPAEPDHLAPSGSPIDRPDAPRYHERAAMPPRPHAAETRRSTPRHARTRLRASRRCGSGRRRRACWAVAKVMRE